VDCAVQKPETPQSETLAPHMTAAFKLQTPCHTISSTAAEQNYTKRASSMVFAHLVDRLPLAATRI
jgi:hypothetical protein